MKWILTQREALINADMIGYMTVEKKRRLESIKTENGHNHIEKIKYAVVAELNYQDEGCDYIYLTNYFDDKEKADEVFKQIVLWLVDENSQRLLRFTEEK